MALIFTVSNHSPKELLHASPQWCSSPEWLHHCNRYAQRTFLTYIGLVWKANFSCNYVELVTHKRISHFLQWMFWPIWKAKQPCYVQRVDCSSSAIGTELHGSTVIQVVSEFLAPWQLTFPSVVNTTPQFMWAVDYWRYLAYRDLGLTIDPNPVYIVEGDLQLWSFWSSQSAHRKRRTKTSLRLSAWQSRQALNTLQNW